MFPPGGMGHCVTPSTPSLKGVFFCIMPCQCTAVSSVPGMALITRTLIVCPGDTVSVGPGQVSFTVICILVGESGKPLRREITSVKSGADWALAVAPSRASTAAHSSARRGRARPA